MPGSSQSPDGYAAARKQVNRWRRAVGASGPRLEACTRPLDYRTGHPREKGRQPQRGYVRWEHRLSRRDYDQVHDSFDYRP